MEERRLKYIGRKYNSSRTQDWSSIGKRVKTIHVERQERGRSPKSSAGATYGDSHS